MMQDTQAPKGLLPWMMWGLGTLFYCYEFFLQVSPSVMVNEMMDAFKVSAGQLGNLTAFYMYAYAIMQIPVGILLDRYGARRLLTFASLFCALGALIFGTADTFMVAAIGRFLIGFGSAFAAVSCMHLAATWLPVRRFALLVGVMLTIGMLGAVFAQGPLSILIGAIGWRHTLILFGALGVLLSIVIYSFVRDRKITSKDEVEFDTGKFFAGAAHVLKHKQSWIVSIYGGLMFLPTPAFAGLWGVPFLMRAHALPRTEAAFLVSLVFIGWAVGSPLFGWFSDTIRKRRPPLMIASAGAMLCMLGILYLINLPKFGLGALLFGFGLFSSAFLPAFSIAREINPPETNATALAFVNTLNSVGAAIAQLMLGILLDVQWHGKVAHNAHVFSISTYQHSLMTLPICMGIALLLTPFIKETYCKPHYA